MMWESTAELKKKVERIAHDLTHLEINTILKPNISGRKMPAVRHALIDIGKIYNWKLSVIGFPPPAPPQSSDPSPKKYWGCYDYFNTLRETADQGIKQLNQKRERTPLSDNEPDTLLMLQRIKDLSDQIKDVLEGLEGRGVDHWDNACSREDIRSKVPPLPLLPAEVVLIRKIWEMGVETIVMQTVIQMDGDVITRIHPRYALPNHQKIHEIHDKGINTAVDFWKELITVVRQFFETLVKMFFPGKLM